MHKLFENPNKTKIQVSISTLEFNIERAKTRPLRVSVRASNKKTANSQCAKEMVRLLFKEGLIEKFGDKMKSHFTPKAEVNLQSLHKSYLPFLLV